MDYLVRSRLWEQTTSLTADAHLNGGIMYSGQQQVIWRVYKGLGAG